MKKLSIIFLLITAMLAAACQNDAIPEPTDSSTIDTPEIVAESAVPEPEKYDFEGRCFTFLDCNWGTYSPLDFIDIVAEEQNGEVFNDAVYDRMTAMRDKYNCDVDHYTTGTPEEELTLLGQTVMSDDKSYDALFLRGRIFSSAVMNGYLTDLSNVPHIDIAKPWWDKNFANSVSIGNTLPALIGYTTTNHMNSVWTVCFNKRLVDDNNLDDPYELVSSGKWTFDKSVEMSIAVARDLDGNTTMNGNDLWGINHTNDTVIGILNSCGVDIAELDSAGKIVLTIDSAKSIERMTDILTKLFNEEYSMDTLSRSVMKSTGSDGDYFAENKVLFLYTGTHLVWQLRQMDVDFGMLPYPKYSESEEYRSSTAGIFLPMTAIPVSSDDIDLTARFLELYAYEGWRLLKPAFYENILVGKVSYDDESKNTLEFIYGNLTYDIGNVLNIGSFTSSIGEMSATLNTNVASFLAEKLPSVRVKLDELNNN